MSKRSTDQDKEKALYQHEPALRAFLLQLQVRIGELEMLLDSSDPDRRASCRCCGDGCAPHRLAYAPLTTAHREGFSGSWQLPLLL